MKLSLKERRALVALLQMAIWDIVEDFDDQAERLDEPGVLARVSAQDASAYYRKILAKLPRPEF